MEGVVADKEPAILAIVPQRSLFDFKKRRMTLHAQPLYILRMKDPCAKIRSGHIFGAEAGVVEHCLVRIDRDTARALDNNGLRYRIGNATKPTFVLPQLFFGRFEILNIGIRSVPPDDIASGVTPRLTPEQEPTILPIVAPQACFELTRFTRSEECPPLLHRLL